MKFCGEKPPNRNTSIKHSLVTVEETSMLGEITNSFAGEGNNTTFSKILNTGKCVPLGEDTNVELGSDKVLAGEAIEPLPGIRC